MSELRGIVLVILGTLALGYYYSWWFHDLRLGSPWLLLGLIVAILYGGIQILGSWLVYLGTHHRSLVRPRTTFDFSVDVFIPTYGEDLELIERALAAACAMRGEHHTWLLDDSKRPALAQMARRLGAGYMTRSDRAGNKPGNINAAIARTSGDIIVIFDVDHVPTSDFLERTVGHFDDPGIGFVQVMLSFRNITESWVAQAASEACLDFYNPTSLGMDGVGSATKIGTNTLIRRAALKSIQGYQYGLADDLATSIALHAAGWRSTYVREPLAPGLVPADLNSWFIQQFKWARGVFEIQLTTFPRLFFQLTAGQRLSYAVRLTYYWAGPVVFLHLLLTIAILFGGNETYQRDFQQYLVHLMPLGLITLFIRTAALRRWRHPSVVTGLIGKAVFLVHATWPIYTMAWIMSVLRLPLSFKVTPKGRSGSLHMKWIIPQLLVALLLLTGVIYALFSANWYYLILLSAWAMVQCVPQLVLFWQWLQQNRNARNLKLVYPELASSSPFPPVRGLETSDANPADLPDYRHS